jgi:signal transduction histidine kinase
VAVFNLILNAVRHAPAGSTVVARLVHRGGRVVAFETENAGPAIDEALASRIFEPFVSRDGTGLGLAIAARSVAASGGSIGLVNGPDRVVFRIELGVTT